MRAAVEQAAGSDVLLAYGTTGLLADFNAAGVLDAPDVRTAQTIGRIGREPDERVVLALALAVRALRSGSVCIDLRTVSTLAFEESEAGIDLSSLPWPDPAEWLALVAASGLVADGPDQPGGRPLRLANGLLYLERYWHQEEQVRRAAPATPRRRPAGHRSRTAQGRPGPAVPGEPMRRTRRTVSSSPSPSARSVG